MSLSSVTRSNGRPGFVLEPFGRAGVLLALVGVALLLVLAPLRVIAVAMALASVVVATLIRPELSLVWVALSVPASSWITVAGGRVSLPDIAVAAALLLWLIDGCRRNALHLAIPRLSLPFVVFLWAAAVSLLGAISWREGLPEWLKWGEFLALWWAGANLVRARTARWVVLALFAAGAFEAALGGYQFLTRSGPEAFLLGDRFLRAFGTLRQPNPYAGYLGYLAPVAASLTLGMLREWWSKRTARAALAVAALAALTVLLAAGIAFSWSRGAWLGLAAALVPLVLLQGRRWALLTVSLALLVAGILAVGGATSWLPAPVSARVSDFQALFDAPDPALTEIDDANFSVMERMAHWRAGLAMYGDHPISGVGIGNYAVAYPSYAPAHWYEPLGHAHNIFINLLAETGLLGAVTFVLFWLAMPVFAALRGLRAAGWYRWMAIGVVGVWTYLTVHGLFDNLFVQHIQLQLALWLAVLSASPTPVEGNSARALKTI